MRREYFLAKSKTLVLKKCNSSCVTEIDYYDCAYE